MATLLPQQYKGSVADVLPTSMGSAGLIYDSEGKVAWNQIWGSFCDLALAGGPPHKGTLLEPGNDEEIAACPSRYKEVVDEICRGIAMVTGLDTRAASHSGWVWLQCENAIMAGWLVRAIATENISVYLRGTAIALPAGPNFRIEKEIKNVITTVAKTCHYWLEHTSMEGRREIEALFADDENQFPLVQPPLSHAAEPIEVNARHGFATEIARSIQRATGLESPSDPRPGWLPLQTGAVRVAIWMMRALVAMNVLSRREGTVLFVALNSSSANEGSVVNRVVLANHYAIYKKYFHAAEGNVN